MRKTVLYFIIFNFIFLAVNAQDLTGTWEGSVRGGAYFKLEIIQSGDTCYGYKYDEGKKGFTKVNMQGIYDSYENTLTGTGIDFIYQTVDDDLSYFNLQYSQKGNKEYLSGFVAPEYIRQELVFVSGFPVQLRKKSNTVTVKKSKPEKDTIINQPEIVIEQSLSVDSITKVKESRKSIVIKTIPIKTDTVKIILKDDGEVDGDIITIFDNGKVIVNKLSLNAEAYELTLSLPSDGSKHVLELVAENEGGVPPNTAYMLVLAGNERVEVKASSDKMSNAAIVIQRE